MSGPLQGVLSRVNKVREACVSEVEEQLKRSSDQVHASLVINGMYLRCNSFNFQRFMLGTKVLLLRPCFVGFWHDV